MVDPEGEGPVDGWMELGGGVVVVAAWGEMLEVQATSVASANGSNFRIEIPARAAITVKPRWDVWRTGVDAGLQTVWKEARGRRRSAGPFAPGGDG